MKKVLITLLVIAMLFTITLVLEKAQTADANPSHFPPTTQTATATTTLAYLSAGAGTTTLAYDSYSSGPTMTNGATLNLWFNATNTTSVLNINTQYSPGSSDGSSCVTSPAKCEWYTAGNFNDGVASTTAVTNLYSPSSYTWTFASSSTNFTGDATNASTTRAIFIKTPMRYVRAVFTSPVGSANLGIWAQFVPIKEN